jgi:hypothetical protein
MALDDYGTPLPPEEIWRGSSAAAIDEANFAGPRNRIYATPLENAYTAELEATDADLAREIVRRRGQEKFRRLVADGARPEEALLLAAPDLFAGDSRAMSRVVGAPGRAAMNGYQPSFEETPYGTVFRTGQGSARLLEQKESPEVLARRDLLSNEIKALQRASADPLAKLAQTPESKQRLADLETQYWATFKKSTAPQMPEMPASALPKSTGRVYFGSKEGGPTEPVRATAAPAAPPAAPAVPFKEGAYIRSKRDGKLYRVVNGVPKLVE